MQRRIAPLFANAVLGAAALLFMKHGIAVQPYAGGLAFSRPDRIRCDSRSLIIEGKPVFIFSGAIHYFRCPRELWKDRLQELKSAGLNCVETYVAWNLHEPEEPASVDDFTKLRDMQQIGDFVQGARDVGLYVIIRPGPYICAECDRGGLPCWLMKHRPDGVRLGQFLRGDSPEMLAWDRHWLAAVAKVVKPHLITNVPQGSPGVILWQLENEYDWNGAGLASDVRANVLRALAQASLDNGIDVPLLTCETMDKKFRDDPFLRSHVFDTVNKYPNYDMKPLVDGIEGRAAYQPDRFRGVTELQGGWFSQVGGSLSGAHNAAQITQLTLTAIERGCTSINYYMFYGGSNFGCVAARSVTQTYDYNAPLREWGGQEDRYFAVKALGLMLQEHGQQLIQSDPVDLAVEGDHKDVSIYLRKSADGSQFYFVRNAQEHESRSGTVKVRSKGGRERLLSYDLGEFEAKLLFVPPEASELADGKWLPKPVERVAGALTSPAAVPARVSVVSISPEEPADAWRDVPGGKHLPFAGVFDQRYVHYRASFDLTAGDLSTPLALFLRSDGGGDSPPARVNGNEAPVSSDGQLPLDGLARTGSNTVEILFENLGCPNFGPVIEQNQGITQISLVPEAARRHDLEKWRMRLIPGPSAGVDPSEVRADFDDHEWQSVVLTEAAATTPAGRTAVYRAAVSFSKERLDAGVVLAFPVIDDSGTLFVNGQRTGTADDWSRPWNFDVTRYLHVGINSIALIVQNDWGDGGPLKGCAIEAIGRGLDNLQVSSDTSVANETMGADERRRFLVHYTMEFVLPRTPPATSTPWKLHLEADANAFVSLNGRPLGRYWAAGPQRNIWLPECWLNFGPEATNVVELQARPTSDAPVAEIIKQVEVQPYVPQPNVDRNTR